MPPPASDNANLPGEVQTFISGLRNISEAEVLASTFACLLHRFGCKYFVISAIPDDVVSLKELLVLHNVPESWVNEYLTNDYVDIDPIVKRCLVSREPFYWSDAEASASAEARQMMRRAEEFGLINGICFPIHNINGFEAGVSVSGSLAPLTRSDVRNLYLASIMTFNALRGIRSDHTLRFEEISMREAEVLTWCALGKTSKEIAYILFISENTVNVHIKNAIHKLSAKNKTEAVAIAVRKRIISL
jgi:LuxR family quorum sensing-dependent transcriptional regulator